MIISKSSNVAKKEIGMWIFFTLGSIYIGWNKAKIPIIKNKLQKLLPIAFPIIKSSFLEIAEEIVINSSGADVPIATIVRPIRISGIWNFVAIFLDPLTKMSAPIIKKANPIINIKIFENIFFLVWYIE